MALLLLQKFMSKRFTVFSKFKPAGDQPTAIAQLVEGINAGLHSQTLLGVTGSGKTFTIANVMEAIQRPTIVMASNKTMAAQLYGEMRRRRRAMSRWMSEISRMRRSIGLTSVEGRLRPPAGTVWGSWMRPFCNAVPVDCLS